jgi:protein-tyrosine-phosphatase
MSRALFDRASEGRHTSDSAGSRADPRGHLHSAVVAAMDELGIDLRDRRPKRLTRELAERADLIVTMGCGDECPYIPGKRYLDWELPDPRGQSLESVRATREDITLRVQDLVGELDAAHG